MFQVAIALMTFDSSVPPTQLVGWECGIDGIWSLASGNLG